MNSQFTIVEASLNRAEFRWKWLRLLQRTSVLGIVAGLGVLLFGVAIRGGWVRNKEIAVTFLLLLAALSFIIGLIIVIATVVGSPEPKNLASAIERSDRRLLDRLHTLLFLENRRGDPRAKLFSVRIARQLTGVLAEAASPPAFASTRALGYVVAFLTVVAVTVGFYAVYSPWNRLVTVENARHNQPSASTNRLELALPTTNNLEQNQAWGEVRITEPGTDLKLTKVDVVPLQIEAAANQALQTVGWYSTVNGAQEIAHELPPPREPRYAVYQPTLYLDELHLADWDVMTYYAKARTEAKTPFASEIYFLEVRPFREDILKMPGGEKGKAYQALNEITSLVNRQQHVIRQTHQHVLKPPELENMRNQDRAKLSAAEGDLRDSARHLYAKMAVEMENKPIGDALDNLAKAANSLDKASGLLGANTMPEAQTAERLALSELVSARKMFQKTLSDNLEAFQEPTTEQETTPVAEAAKQLSQMAEFRNEAQAAQEFLKKSLQQQRMIEQHVKSAPKAEFPKMAEEENQLQQSIEDFQSLHPGVFKETKAESGQAKEALSQAASVLREKGDNATAATRQATRELEHLSQTLANQSAGRELADAYKLKQMLDRQIRTLDEGSKSNSTIPEAELRTTATAGRKTIDQLARTAEQEPTRDAFGQSLRETLSGQNKVEIQTRLLQLEQEKDKANQPMLAGQARDALAKVSKAFEESQPKSLQLAQKNDALQSGGADQFSQGVAELESLLRQQEAHRKLDSQAEAKQRRQAFADLQAGIQQQPGDNEKGQQLLLRLERLLKAETPPELADLKKLLEELQHFSVETSEQRAKKQDQPELTNIDPARLPPAYRSRIQKYFQRLSEN